MKLLIATILLSGSLAGAESEISSHAYGVFDGPVKYAADFQAFDYTSDKAKKGGIYKQGLTGSFDSINPLTVKGNPNVHIIGLVFETLLTRSGDELGVYYGQIASTVTWPKDHTWVKFKIRPEARFHDGSKITAEDIEFSYSYLRKEGHPRYSTDLQDVRSVSTSADHSEVTFQFKASSRTAAAKIGMMPVLSKKYYEKQSLDQTLLAPMGSGPYRIQDYVLGHHITFERVKNHWGKDLGIYKNRYNFDQVHIDYYLNGEATFSSLRTGGVTIREEGVAKNWLIGYDFPAARDGKVVRLTLPNNGPIDRDGLFFNTRRKWLKNAKLRRALSLAFDYEWVNSNFFFSSYKRNNGYFDGTDLASVGKLDDQEIAILNEAAKFGEVRTSLKSDGPFENPVYDEKNRTLRSGLIEARDLIRAEGYTIPPGKTVYEDKSGNPLSLEILGDSAGIERVLLYYASALKKLGVDANVRTVNATEFYDRTKNFDFGAGLVDARESYCLLEGFLLAS